ncbi:MAG: response regulator transcription factor [Mariprofundaceae bacterium]|nr:response regulator transcription factor [Mariprofundaceae bacterium]
MNLQESLPTLLLVDDDEIYCRVLRSALEKRGFEVQVAHHVTQAMSVMTDFSPECAVVDLNMPGPSGLVLVEALHAFDHHTHIVVLTGFASIATAVEAIKLGATHYLAKPVDADAIMTALNRTTNGDTSTQVATQPMSTKRLEWEHIQKILMECEGNISETARKLGMHRRTLQRKLAKRPTKT